MSDLPLTKGRSNARKKVLQALYQWDLSGNEINDIEVQFHDEQNMEKVDLEYFHELLHGIPAQVDELDALILPLLDRNEEHLDPVERAILRLGTYELKHRPDVPFAVVIGEGIQLSRTFGADQSHKYINGVLDKLAKQLRPGEVKSKA